MQSRNDQHDDEGHRKAGCEPSHHLDPSADHNIETQRRSTRKRKEIASSSSKQSKEQKPIIPLQGQHALQRPSLN